MALVIDDETDFCFLLSGILKQKNIHTVQASSLQETDRILQSAENFGIIFLDNHLPDGLGVSYIQKLKKRFPGSRIIMVTADDTSLDQAVARTNGADQFRGKPFSKEVILNTVENYTA